MNILITGNTGYIGPVVISALKKKYPHYKYIGIDTGFFVHNLMTNDELPDRKFNVQYWEDVRNIPINIFDNIDAVIHLAAISNDPMGNKFEKVTNDINLEASINIAKLSKKAGVKNFVFASSCSVYGFAGEDAKTENDELNPLTAYAKSKIGVEDRVKDIASEKFIVTSLRFATACGWSPRLRLDLVLNDFVASAISSGTIEILSDGTPWRPLINVSDMARAMDWAMHRKIENGGKYISVNIGKESWNYQVKQIAEAICDIIPKTNLSIDVNAQPDKRSYKVDFSLFRQLAPDYQPIKNLDQTIKEIYGGLQNIGFNDKKFRDSKYMRLNSLNYLIKNNILDNDLNWRK